MASSTGLVPDDVVIKARRLARENPEMTNREIAEQFDVHLGSLENAIRGKTYKHLNDNEPPVSRPNKKEDKREQVREMYQRGMSYREILKEVKVAKASLSLWLKDIVRPPKRANAPISRFPAESPYLGYIVSTSTGHDGKVRYRLDHPDTGDHILLTAARYIMSVKVNRILTSDEVVIHKEGHSDSIDNLLLLTREEYRLKRISDRDRPCEECGVVFKRKRGNVKTCSQKCAIALREKNNKALFASITRTCLNCSTEFSPRSHSDKYCDTKCKVQYREKNRPTKKTPRVRKPKPPKPQKHVINCVICEKDFKTLDPEAEVCTRKKCQKVLAEMDEYGR